MFKMMGWIQSSHAKKLKEDEAKARSDMIDNQLARDALKAKDEIKILLWEAGDAGGSTFLRQMRLIHHGGFSDSELEAYKEIMFSNTIQSMQAILEAIPQLGLSLASQNDVPSSTILLLPRQVDYEVLPQGVSSALRSLWHDPAVREAVHRSSEFYLNDSAMYYFDAIPRMASSNYVPTNQDIMRCRVKTTGIAETSFRVGKLAYTILDPAGQRSERKKWIHQFENVTAILFMASMADYDEVLLEDQSVNRMKEAFILFDTVCNSRWFCKTSIILILNHIDRFAEKLPHSPLENYFSDYQSGNNYNAACDYLLHRFVSLNRNSSRKQIYAHYTCPTDIQQHKFILSSIQDISLQLYLRGIKLL